MNRATTWRSCCKYCLGSIVTLAGACLATGCAKTDLSMWQVHEITLTATVSHAHPAQVELWATFQGPDGETIQVPGFWDGGDTWRVRFAPTRQGRWTWVTACSEIEDTGLHKVTGKLRVGPPEGENAMYQHGGFLQVSANRRYLTYTDGTPFFWLGDTWWCCPSALVPIDGSSDPAFPSMYKALVDRRSEQGYTVVHWGFQTWGYHGPSLVPDSSFTNLAMMRRVNPKFWQKVDAYVIYATEAGLLPAMALTWYSELDRLALEDLEFLWHYVIARYGAYPVTWLITGEYNVREGNDISGRIAKVAALGQYIKATDPYHRAMSVHPWWYQNDNGQIWDEPWYDFIMFQAGHQSYPGTEVYLKAYERDDPKPIVEGEANYEGIMGVVTDNDVRWSAYRAMQAGGCGFTYGSHRLWCPANITDRWGEPVPWQEALDRPGGAQMTHLRALYESVPWWELEPRPDALQVRGLSTFMMRPLAKAAGDDIYVIYFGGGLQPDVSVSLLEAPRGARYDGNWFDPRTGETVALENTLVADADGTQLPARPSAQDWVMVLRRQHPPEE
jgi:hypothetical protein